MEASKNQKAALIYNPKAGEKRNIVPGKNLVALEDIKKLLVQYQIVVDYFPTKSPGHATELAAEAVKKGYKLVLAAGGDGTVGEVANGLIGTDATLGIIPLGSFMNVAKMLSIPLEMEKAVALIKINKTRKIDLGCVTKLEDKILNPPQYFLESAGIGLEAEVFGYIHEIERGNYKAVFRLFKTYFEFLHHKIKIMINEKEEIDTRAALVTISNGPIMGASIPIAPTAKLNDHFLTLSIFKMTKYELLIHFLNLSWGNLRKNRKVQVKQAKKITLNTHSKRLVHADGRFFGKTPAEFTILPNALNVITGFPTLEEKPLALIDKTYLDY